jgi:hypothetical protein
MKSKVLTYFYDIPDELLTLMAMYNWGKLEELCTLLTLDIEVASREGLKN